MVAGLRTTLGKPSASAHSVKDLNDRNKWTFGDLEAFAKLLKSFEKEVLAAYELKDEFRPLMREVESNLLKGMFFLNMFIQRYQYVLIIFNLNRLAETRKEEIVRFSKAKADPEFVKMLKARTLGPDAAETQSQLRRQIRVRCLLLFSYLY